eukprot:3424026-Prymnesium_polylepis.1
MRSFWGSTPSLRAVSLSRPAMCVYASGAVSQWSSSAAANVSGCGGGCGTDGAGAGGAAASAAAG